MLDRGSDTVGTRGAGDGESSPPTLTERRAKRDGRLVARAHVSIAAQIGIE
jgi:hypothetical protein